jgi:hypothetical protein
LDFKIILAQKEGWEMNNIQKAKQEFRKKFQDADHRTKQEMEEFLDAVPENYVRQNGLIQACNYYEAWEGWHICVNYFAGMCNCPLNQDCPFGNENKIWLEENEEAETHSRECLRVRRQEQASWVSAEEHDKTLH